jgi:hypothetical protein
MFLPKTKIRKNHPLEGVGVNVEGGGFVGSRFRLHRWKEDRKLRLYTKIYDFRMPLSDKTGLDFIKFSAVIYSRGGSAERGWCARFVLKGLRDTG